MSEEQKKFSFFKSIKNAIGNSDENQEQKPATNNEEESVMKPINVKSVNPSGSESETKTFKGISTADDLDVCFAENFVHSGGKFIFTENEEELIHFLNSLKNEHNWNHIFSIENKIARLFQQYQFQTEELEITLDKADAAISLCHNLSAKEGIIVLSPEEATTRRLVTFPKNHIIVAYKNQLKKDIKEAIFGFRDLFGDRLPSILELYTEKPVSKSNHKTVLSADGPENVFLFYIDKDIEQ